jgi:hypothetical protein
MAASPLCMNQTSAEITGLFLALIVTEKGEMLETKLGLKPETSESLVRCSTSCTTWPQVILRSSYMTYDATIRKYLIFLPVRFLYLILLLLIEEDTKISAADTFQQQMPDSQNAETKGICKHRVVGESFFHTGTNNVETNQRTYNDNRICSGSNWKSLWAISV